ncbi:MAG: DUF2306 domain-containing protein [Cyclobacteriaceae bacterium]|nr:DUF2306 domain-containing protein [Cyclobacteriaceae bacterium]UYN88268.1 MAG: DUF2306 domain-containing protein [Cyclobacteriaceae bacterium]
MKSLIIIVITFLGTVLAKAQGTAPEALKQEMQKLAFMAGNSLVHSPTGLIHLFSAILALITGTIVLFSTKGTRSHRSTGYGYIASMLILNGTAFGLYRLFGRFGPFHVAALVSMLTLLMGILPLINRQSSGRWLVRHLTWMYYSVIGLYAAFASEIIVRIPGLPFAVMVVTASVTVTGVGVFIFIKNHQSWIKNIHTQKLHSHEQQR